MRDSKGLGSTSRINRLSGEMAHGSRLGFELDGATIFLFYQIHGLYGLLYGPLTASPMVKRVIPGIALHLPAVKRVKSL